MSHMISFSITNANIYKGTWSVSVVYLNEIKVLHSGCEVSHQTNTVMSIVKI
jgi:hypothetical protein